MKQAYTDARNQFKLCIKENPDHDKAHFQLAVLYEVYLRDFDQDSFNKSMHHYLSYSIE